RGRGCLRFAFYGRVSTEDWQDPVTSRARQLAQAVMLMAGRRVIVAEFFDTGQHRVLAWPRRPRVAAFVAALADPNRGWDALVIGEYERAFYGSQYASMAPLSSTTVSSCGRPKLAGGSTCTPKTTRRPCSRWARRPSGRSPVPGSGCAPQWPPRPGSRAGTWAGARRTGTASVMPGRIRTRPTRRGAGARTARARRGRCGPGPGVAKSQHQRPRRHHCGGPADRAACCYGRGRCLMTVMTWRAVLLAGLGSGSRASAVMTSRARPG
ncbi:MAG: site-specific recombinase, partial [Mycobacterium sp.]|nr:site-specific recombinase [Mycobacterium sp.]